MKRSTLVPAILLVLALAACGWLAVQWKSAEERAERAERLSVEPIKQRVLLHEFELARLRDLGLQDPVADLKADLTSHPEIVPYEGVLGGRMAFYDKDAMVFLPGGYVYAPADDGHYEVHALLRYEVSQGGSIRWRLVDARKD
ncbi:MAG TPA: hypothetical protein VFP58_09485 [Candidatus Eisenbacteria bacterium]|nr:hypothetical protein [Candidatus Eisenbacteria bacterium]